MFWRVGSLQTWIFCFPIFKRCLKVSHSIGCSSSTSSANSFSLLTADWLHKANIHSSMSGSLSDPGGVVREASAVAIPAPVTETELFRTVSVRTVCLCVCPHCMFVCLSALCVCVCVCACVCVRARTRKRANDRECTCWGRVVGVVAFYSVSMCDVCVRER